MIDLSSGASIASAQRLMPSLHVFVQNSTLVRVQPEQIPDWLQIPEFR